MWDNRCSIFVIDPFLILVVTLSLFLWVAIFFYMPWFSRLPTCSSPLLWDLLLPFPFPFDPLLLLRPLPSVTRAWLISALIPFLRAFLLNKQSLTILKDNLLPGAELLIVTARVSQLSSKELKRNNACNSSPTTSSKVDNGLTISWKSLKCSAIVRPPFSFRLTSFLIRKALFWAAFLWYRLLP